MILAIVALVILSILSLVSFYISNKKSQALSKPNQILSNRRAIAYYLAFSILISAGGVIALSPAASRSMLYFILMQVAYAGLGYLVAYLYRRYAPEEMTKGQGRFAGVFFVLANALIGMMGFMLAYRYFSTSDDIAPWFALCVLPFILPQFLKTSLDAYRQIPQDIHKVWYFPLDEDEVDYDKVDTSTIYMLEVEYSKSINDPRLTNTKLRAPVSMKFSDWFRSFIDTYNYKHESDPIQYAYPDQTPVGWIFYVKPWLLGSARYIDPDLTITGNKIIEKNIIQAKRVVVEEEEEAE